VQFTGLRCDESEPENMKHKAILAAIKGYGSEVQKQDQLGGFIGSGTPKVAWSMLVCTYQ
jgi:hypothetical protein